MLHEQCETLFAGMKGQQWPKSIGKSLNKSWYVAPVLYTGAMKTELVHVYTHEKNGPDVWISMESKWQGNPSPIW